MSALIRYRATYNGAGCTWGTTDGRTGTVMLDKDPGYGSMNFHRIHVSMVVLGERLPAFTEADYAVNRLREQVRTFEFIGATNPARVDEARARVAELERQITEIRSA